jgi:hypothetical protein
MLSARVFDMLLFLVIILKYSMYYIKSSESPYAIPQNFNFIMLYVTTNKSITLIKQLHKSEDILNKRKADHRLCKSRSD